jgi:hypothetical protein
MRWATAIVLAAVAALPVLAQGTGGPVLAPAPKACETPGTQVISASPLPNVAIALKDRKQIKILAVGSTSASLRGPVSGGQYAMVERFLESNFKGLDVNIVYRGVSGELAADAADRIKNEVALTGADLVLWQLGTADALAQVPWRISMPLSARLSNGSGTITSMSSSLACAMRAAWSGMRITRRSAARSRTSPRNRGF